MTPNRSVRVSAAWPALRHWRRPVTPLLVLKQHYVAGGLTQTFHRRGFRWDLGVHYLGEMGPEGEAHAILIWLADGAIKFASLGAVYDLIHLPGNFEVRFARADCHSACTDLL